MAFELVDTNSLGNVKGFRQGGRRGWRRRGRDERPDDRGEDRGRHGEGHDCCAAGHGRHGGDHCCRGAEHGRHGRCRAHRQGERRLCEAGAGDTVTVTGILGDESFRGRIMAMGIVPGLPLKVVGGGGRQPLLVALPGSRCVVDRRSSEMIAVSGARSAAGRERMGA